MQRQAPCRHVTFNWILTEYKNDAAYNAYNCRDARDPNHWEANTITVEVLQFPHFLNEGRTLPTNTLKEGRQQSPQSPQCHQSGAPVERELAIPDSKSKRLDPGKVK